MKILVAEDDPVLQCWLQAKLVLEQGFLVHIVDNGDEALELFLTQRPWDVLLTDYLFNPGERINTGLDLVREVLRVNPDQRIVVHTSEERLRVPPGVKLLRKPYGLKTLLRYLRPSVQPLLPLP